MSNRMKILEKDAEKLVWVKGLLDRNERKIKAKKRRKFDAEKRKEESHKKQFSVWKTLGREVVRDDEELEVL
jgi:macrodomain Ter protein organizer (MatP/YcbG family)